MQWRRAALPALVIGLIITPVLGALLAQNKFSGYSTALATGALTPEAARAGITVEMMFITWLGVSLILTLMLPLVVADTIPKDQHLGVRELLGSLPLGPGAYLTGKLCSLWLSLLAGLGLAALIAGGAWRLLIGPFDLAIYGELWLVGVLTLAFVNAGLSMLLAAGQPTTYRAIIVGGAFSLLCLLGVGFALATYGEFWDLLNPARPVLWLYYLIGWPGAMRGTEIFSRFSAESIELVRQVVNRERMFLSIAVGAAQVGIVWSLVWLWLQRHEG
jgi:hypothetical protein